MREALEHDARQDRFYRASTDALDRVEAVVKAAREVVETNAAYEAVQALARVLAALDSTEAPEPWHTEVSCSDDVCSHDFGAPLGGTTP